jgi:acetyltransferase-like isoleucine patch superfamily enzyme
VGRLDDLAARARGSYYRWRFRLAGGKVRIGRGFRAYGPLEVFGQGRIEIGDGVTVRRDPFGRRGVVLQTLASAEARIEIGDGAELRGTHVASAKLVQIGAGARLEDARVMDSDFHVTSGGHGREPEIADARSVVIGERAWVGGASLVLKGAVVGREAVVRPGSVVLRKVPDGAVASGYPARPEGGKLISQP